MLAFKSIVGDSSVIVALLPRVKLFPVVDESPIKLVVSLKLKAEVEGVNLKAVLLCKVPSAIWDTTKLALEEESSKDTLAAPAAPHKISLPSDFKTCPAVPIGKCIAFWFSSNVIKLPRAAFCNLGNVIALFDIECSPVPPSTTILLSVCFVNIVPSAVFNANSPTAKSDAEGGVPVTLLCLIMILVAMLSPIRSRFPHQ